MTNTAAYTINGGDYENGGIASKSLKEMLKKIGVDPRTIRRTMVAAYEAEMNVVIHARRGTMEVAVDPFQVDVAVTDEGPGIADIELAMKEGYSTAPAEARALGFGAGMGLPNIRRNSDRFSIRSTVGQGSVIRFAIWLQPERIATDDGHSVQISPEICCQCLKCLRVCPTAAIRVRDDHPSILDHLCADCVMCMAVCDTHAISVECPSELPATDEETSLVLPSSFLEQFGMGIRPHHVLEALAEMGYRHVRLLEEFDLALREATVAYAKSPDRHFPVIAPMCPVVTNLIQVKFPSLICNIAPFLSPVEAAREALRVPHATFLVTCPSQRTALNAPSLLTRIDAYQPAALRNSVMALLANRLPLPDADLPPEFPVPKTPGVLEVSGMRHVLRALDEIENGRMAEYPVVELYACDQGCFGSPAWNEAAFMARSRWAIERDRVRTALASPRGEAIRRTTPFEPRSGLRLDSNMSTAIEKLSQIDAWTKRLPGRNCGVCGAPTCAALAEDIVLGRTTAKACVFRRETEGNQS